MDDFGLITGWKKTDKYIGEYKNGCRHGNGIEYDYDVNIDYEMFKKREGRWHNDKFIEGKVNDVIIYKDEDNEYSWESDEQGLPQTKAWMHLRDMLQNESPANCRNYYFADMTLLNDEYEIVDDTLKPICSQLGGAINMYCYECEFE